MSLAMMCSLVTPYFIHSQDDMEGRDPDFASQGELLSAGEDRQGRPAEGPRRGEVHLRCAAPALPRRTRRTAEAVRVGALRLRPGDLLEG